MKVTYIDSCTIDTQTSEVAKPMTIEATGFKVRETDEYITIAREKIGDEWRGQLSIPKVAVIK